MKNLIKRLRLAATWFRMVGAYRANDLKRARRLYEKFATLRDVQPRHRAFDATLSILERDSSAGRTKFERVLSDLEALGEDDQNSKYVEHYVRYYLLLMDENPLAEQERAAAEECKPEGFIRRPLPLPSAGFV